MAGGESTAGEGGVAGVRGERPDPVVLDISLPGMDGTELLRHIRAEPALNGVFVVALTAHAMTGDRERYLDLGFDHYLSKPIVDEAELFAVLSRLLPD